MCDAPERYHTHIGEENTYTQRHNITNRVKMKTSLKDRPMPLPFVDVAVFGVLKLLASEIGKPDGRDTVER